MSEMPDHNLLISSILHTSEITERQQLIDTIIAQDHAEFTKWSDDPNNEFRLDMPYRAARYLLIPPKVLELSDDPSKVDIHLLESTEREIKSVVYEKKDNPVTNEASFKEYLPLLENWLRNGKITSPPKCPTDVDFFHGYLSRCGYSRKFSLNDFIINTINLSGLNAPVMMVDGYQTRYGYTELGIGTSFYERLHTSAADLGYRFVAGYNKPQNIKFFKEKLGRVSLDQIRLNLRSHFHPVITPRSHPEYFTVDFLYPEDKNEYVIGNSRL